MTLVVDNLTLERGGRTIVSGLSFELGRGEALVLTGPNGAGKTSLLRAIAGFLPARSGAVRLSAVTTGANAATVIPAANPDDDGATVGERCHYVGHRDGVKGSLSVVENARFWSRYLAAGDGDGSVTAAALERVGLAALADVPAAYLSAGQKRRLGIARLLLASRPLWLLDEPTVSLDAAGVAMLAELVAGHLASGGLVMAATHVPLGFDGARELVLGARGEAASALDPDLVDGWAA